MALTVNGSTYLNRLLDDVTRLSDLITPSHDTDHDVDRFVAACLTLDGAPTDELMTVAKAKTVLAASDTATAGYDAKPGSWQQTLKLTGDTDTDVLLLRATETIGLANALACPVTGPADTFLREVHKTLTRGLIADARHGQFREHDVAVHDSGTGRVLYQPHMPEQIPDGYQALTDTIDSQQHDPLVTAALVVYLCHVVQPFDAANGRLGFSTARLLVNDAAPMISGCEAWLATDKAGFHTEIAQTLRRKDATYFVERYVEACTLALRETARTQGALDTSPTLPRAVLATLTTQPFITVKDVDRDVMDTLLDAGLLTPVAGMHGLKFVSHLAR